MFPTVEQRTGFSKVVYFGLFCPGNFEPHCGSSREHLGEGLHSKVPVKIFVFDPPAAEMDQGM